MQMGSGWRVIYCDEAVGRGGLSQKTQTHKFAAIGAGVQPH